MNGAVWGPLMFLGALGFIFTGYPVAFALAGTALLFAVLGSATGAFDLVLLTALPSRTFGTMSNYTLLAVPFFIYMGTVLEKSRLAEDLLETIGLLFGRYVLRMEPLVLLGAESGAGTTTAALRAVQDVSGSKLPVLGYTVPYAVANILLTAWGPVVVALMR